MAFDIDIFCETDPVMTTSTHLRQSGNFFFPKLLACLVKGGVCFSITIACSEVHLAPRVWVVVSMFWFLPGQPWFCAVGCMRGCTCCTESCLVHALAINQCPLLKHPRRQCNIQCNNDAIHALAAEVLFSCCCALSQAVKAAAPATEGSSSKRGVLGQFL